MRCPQHPENGQSRHGREFLVKHRMRYFLDVEFNGFGGPMISIAAVAEDDETQFFYEAVECVQPTDWVKSHVLPVLQTKPVAIGEMTRRFSEFLQSDPAPIIVADWPEDIVHAAALLTNGLGRRLLDNEVQFKLLEKSDFSPSHLSEVPHNAYYDALALRRWTLANEVV